MNVSVNIMLDCTPICRERRCNDFHVVCRLGRHLKEALDVYGQDNRVWKKNQQLPDGSDRFLVMQNLVQVRLQTQYCYLYVQYTNYLRLWPPISTGCANKLWKLWF